MSKHTPGPWKSTQDGFIESNEPIEKGETEKKIIADVWGDDRNANAFLMAAAPEMLEALEELDSFEFTAYDRTMVHLVQATKKAIKKAKGEV